MLEATKPYFIKAIGNFKDFIIVTYIIIDDIYQSSTPIHIKDSKNVKMLS